MNVEKLICGLMMIILFMLIKFFFFSPHFFVQAQKVSDDLLQKIGSKNRRALDLVAAKCYYYHARVYEFLNQLDTIRR